jgi:hypothetical protein
MRFWGLIIAAVFLATAAQAQTWKAELEKLPNSTAKCPDIPLVFDLAVSGGDISLTTPAGKTFQGKVAADGNVSLQYPGAAGTTVVSGNAHTKDLRMSASRLDGCFYAIRPISAAAAQQMLSWNATIQQISGNVQTCRSGYRGRVHVRGQSLLVYGFDVPNDALFGVRLAADGSADVDTRTALGANSTARVKVAPGTGPRVVNFVTYTNACNYRIVPD